MRNRLTIKGFTGWLGPLCLAGGLALTVGPAAGEVLSVDAGGFHIRHVVESAMPPAQAYADAWWADSHTYSGAAGNLSLALNPGGCWCEALKDGGSVRHMSVEYVAPGSSVRLSGGLGPLQTMGVAGALAVSFAPKDSGATLTIDYRVSGRADGGWVGLSAAVDRVLGEQFARLAALPAR
jgi:hypothetical protein